MAAPGLGSRRRVVMAVEDDDEVYCLIRSALADLGSGLDVQRVTNAEDALQFLRGMRPHEQTEIPRLVIVDAASSARDAWSLLEEMRKQVHLQSLPVVVVGPEPASRQGMNASAFGAQFYIDRSVEGDAFREQVKEACLFSLWLSTK